MSSNTVNNNKKKIWGLAGLLVSLVMVGILTGLASKSLDYISAIYAGVLINLTNNSRATENLANLKENPLLVSAAQLKADDMAEKGYFAHNSPDGKTPWYWLEQAGYDYKYAGENLAINFNDSADVEKAWMASPTHRFNILNRNFTEIGIATSTGTYQGRSTTFVVQMFGRPE